MYCCDNVWLFIAIHYFYEGTVGVNKKLFFNFVGWLFDGLITDGRTTFLHSSTSIQMFSL